MASYKKTRYLVDFTYDFKPLFEKINKVYPYGKTKPEEAWKDMEEMGNDIYMLTLLSYQLMSEVEHLSQYYPENYGEISLCPICCDRKWSRPFCQKLNEIDFTKRQCSTCQHIRKDKDD